jgi:outer membrane receptor protein involved in Fe transport
MPPAATPADQAAAPEIIVTGIRASVERAISIKRNAPNVVDAISAQDIGKLPDATISDSLQRIPGVQIRRDAGEGSTVNVRGLPQVVTLMNGESFLGAGSITSVQPSFTDIPALFPAPASSILDRLAALGGYFGHDRPQDPPPLRPETGPARRLCDGGRDRLLLQEVRPPFQRASVLAQ